METYDDRKDPDYVPPDYQPINAQDETQLPLTNSITIYKQPTQLQFIWKYMFKVFDKSLDKLNVWNIKETFKISQHLIQYELDHFNNKAYKSRYKDKVYDKFFMKYNIKNDRIVGSTKRIGSSTPIQYLWDNINEGHKYVLKIGDDSYATVDNYDIAYSGTKFTLTIWIYLKRKHGKHGTWIRYVTRAQHQKSLRNLEKIIEKQNEVNKKRKEAIEKKLLLAKKQKQEAKALKKAQMASKTTSTSPAQNK